MPQDKHLHVTSVGIIDGKPLVVLSDGSILDGVVSLLVEASTDLYSPKVKLELFAYERKLTE